MWAVLLQFLCAHGYVCAGMCDMGRINTWMLLKSEQSDMGVGWEASTWHLYASQQPWSTQKIPRGPWQIVIKPLSSSKEQQQQRGSQEWCQCMVKTSGHALTNKSQLCPCTALKTGTRVGQRQPHPHPLPYLQSSQLQPQDLQQLGHCSETSGDESNYFEQVAKGIN